MTPFLRKLGPKIQFLRSFTNFFWNYTGLQHKLLMLIESPNICDWKSTKESKLGVVCGAKFGTMWKQRKTGISMGFLDILHEVYIYKHEVVCRNTWVKIEGWIS